MICAGCGHGNSAGARFCEQCGGSLDRRCDACGGSLSPTARFCSSCGAPALPTAPAGAPREAVLKVVSVVFSDLVGSTALQESLDNETVRRVMARFYEAMRAVVADHDGQIQKFIGDAVVVVFGVPAVREDDALRAVRCAAAMVAELERLNQELARSHGVRLAIRTGVNTGELVVSHEGIFVGDTMNTAARLEQAASPGEILLGETTQRLVRRQVTLEEVAPLDLKGKSGQVRAWHLVSVAAATADELDGAGTGAAEAPLVGREPELRRLRAALDLAVAQRGCRLITVIGSPGLGKSRLAREFAVSLGDGARVLEGHCEPSGEGITFLPVADVLRSAAGIGEADPPDLVEQKLAGVAGDDPEAALAVRRAASVLGAGGPASPEETFWGFRRVLESLAQPDRPLVVVLDDVHWGQPMFLDLVEHLVEWVRDAPILLVALTRPELRELRAALTTPGRRAIDVIELAPLAPDQSRELIDGLLGAIDVGHELLRRIFATTGGNPLFLGELLRMLVDDGALVPDPDGGGGWAAAGDADSVHVPPTIQALLTARIERLRTDERTVVERAAVIGQQFYRGAVAELTPAPVSAALDGHLETLRRKEMVEPEGTYWIDEPVYRFHHVLIRDAAYHLLLKEARAELHERFADWLEAKAGELVGEHEEVIAYHLEQAHEYRRQLGPLDDRGRALGERAAERLASAGRRALAREDLAAAANLLRRALDRHPGQPEPELLWDLGEALLTAGETASAAAVVAQLEPVAPARAAVLAGQLSALTGDVALPAVLDTVARALDELSTAGDGAAVAKGHHVLAQIQAQLGRVADVEASLDRALLAARAVDDRRRITAVLAAAPRAALWGPSPVVRASGRCLDAVRILRMTPGNRHVEAVALGCQAVLEAMRGRPQAAREILSSGRATLQELGLTLELHELETQAGIVELLAGEPEAARDLLSEARRGFDALGLSVGAAQSAALLARALVELARDDEALAACEFAERHAGGELKTTIAWMGVRAEALARREDAIEEALTLARRGVSLAEPTDALADKADAHMALARVALAAGHRAAAGQAAADALALYEAKDHAVGVRRARELTGASGPAANRPAPRAAPLGRQPSERVAAEVLRLFHARDHDALARIVAPDAYAVDHRALGWDEARGRDQVLAIMGSWLDASPNLRVEYDEVLACDDRLLAVRMAWRGEGVKAGELELRVGAVHLIEDGLWRGIDFYEADDRTAIIARYVELGGGQAPLGDREGMLRRFGELGGSGAVLGDRPPERVVRETQRLLHERRYDLMRAIVAEDWRSVDHRAVGWENYHGRDQWEAITRSFFDASPSAHIDYQEVLACDERVIALRLAWRSEGIKAGPLEVLAGGVYVIDDGQWISADYYDPDDRQAMIARYAELGGGLGPLGDSPPERWLAEWARRYPTADFDGIAALTAPGCRFEDHRRLGWDPISSENGLAELAQSIWAGTSDVRLEVDEVLARDERAAAVRLSVHATSRRHGIRSQTATGAVIVVQDGRVVSWDQYDDSDRGAILARYAEVGGRRELADGAPSEPEGFFAEFFERLRARDYDRLAELIDEDWSWTDHRALGWEDARGREACLATMRSLADAAPGVTVEFDEILACDHRVIAVRQAWRGHGIKAGELEVLAGAVFVVEDRRWLSADFYDPDDRRALIARYAELGGGLGLLGDSPVERLLRHYAERYAARDLEAITAALTAEWVHTDHRLIGWTVTDVERYREDQRLVWQSCLDVRAEVDEVLACDGRVLAGVMTYRGTALPEQGGGRFEYCVGFVCVTENDRAVRLDWYDPADRGAIIAQYAELRAAASSDPVPAPGTRSPQAAPAPPPPNPALPRATRATRP